jgi:Domain of unknown function (DUF4389)
MKLTIKHQEEYSRGELILRSFFGWIYILLPHAFLLFFVQIAGYIVVFLSFWAILFTGKYPKSFFDFMVGMYRWSLRVNARMYNLSDGYPAFGVNGEDDHTSLEVEYPESLSRGLQVVKLLFGYFYCAIPHFFVLYLRLIWGMILMFLAFWVVLFTGKYPANWHAFNVGTQRWIMRVTLYLSFMTDDYPRFTGKEYETNSNIEGVLDSDV